MRVPSRMTDQRPSPPLSHPSRFFPLSRSTHWAGAGTPDRSAAEQRNKVVSCIGSHLNRDGAVRFLVTGCPSAALPSGNAAEKMGPPPVSIAGEFGIERDRSRALAGGAAEIFVQGKQSVRLG